MAPMEAAIGTAIKAIGDAIMVEFNTLALDYRVDATPQMCNRVTITADIAIF